MVEASFAAVEAEGSVGVEAAATVQLETALVQSVPPVHAEGVLSGGKPSAEGADGSVKVVGVVVAGLSMSFAGGAGVAEAHAPVCGPSRYFLRLRRALYQSSRFLLAASRFFLMALYLANCSGVMSASAFGNGQVGVMWSVEPQR